MYGSVHEAEEAEFGFGPRLWDADPEVCCAAFQLGACIHTEGDYPEADWTPEEWAAAGYEPLAPAAAVSQDEEPF